MFKLLCNIFVVISVGVLCTLIVIKKAQANDALDAHAAGWVTGTSLAEYKPYKDFYEATTDRSITYVLEREEEGYLVTTYKAKFKKDGVEREASGVVTLDVIADMVVGSIEYPIEKSLVDLAVAGQAGDLATTVIGIGLGASEANPIMAPLTEGPAGFIVMAGLKYGLVKWGDSLDFRSCVNVRKSAAQIGMGLTVSNLVTVVSGVTPLGLAIGIGTYLGTKEKSLKDAVARCL